MTAAEINHLATDSTFVSLRLLLAANAPDEQARDDAFAAALDESRKITAALERLAPLAEIARPVPRMLVGSCGGAG